MNSKQQQRTAAMDARSGQDPALGLHLAGHVLNDWRFRLGSVIAGFWPLPGEIDIRPLLLALAALGYPIVLPVTPSRGNPLTFQRWQPGDTLIAERFGTVRPTGVPMSPDLLFVPMLAFDDGCQRLGYGGGFYDRTLAGLPGRIAIGCAFSAQRVDCVIADAHDIRLHAVATERGLMLPKG